MCMYVWYACVCVCVVCLCVCDIFIHVVCVVCSMGVCFSFFKS